MSVVTVTVEINERSIQDKISSLLSDEVLTEINGIVAEMCDPYVPFDTGNLAQDTMFVDADGVHYTAEYAEKQYYGTEFQHNLTHHPKATALWDKVMVSEQGDLLRERITEVLRRRAKQLYG